MSYRLKRREPVPVGIRRVVTEQIDDCVRQLDGAAGDAFDAAVHESRRSFKRIRGVLRLVRDELGNTVYKHENRTFRDLGRQLSPVRDAYVMLATLDKLAERYPNRLPVDYLETLREKLHAEHRARRTGNTDGENPSEGILRELRAARTRLPDWPLDTDSFDALAPGLARIYRQSAEALETARASQAADDYHELRKRVKDQRCHTRLLRPVWPQTMKTRDKELKRLTDLLGNEHDLSVLLERLLGESREPSGQSARFLVFELIEEARSDAREELDLLAGRLFAEPPAVFVNRLAAYWDEWRSAAARLPAG